MSNVDDLIALTEEWAKKQLTYSDSGFLGEKYPRDQAIQARVHSTIAYSIARVRRSTDVAPLLNHVLQRVLMAQTHYDDDDRGWSLIEESFALLAWAYISSGDYVSALNAIRQIQTEPQRVATIADLAIIALKNGEKSESATLQGAALTEAVQIENEYLRSAAYSELLPRLMQLNDISGALEAAALVTNQGTTERQHLRKLIQELCDRHEAAHAEQVARLFQSPLERSISLAEISAAMAVNHQPYSRELAEEAEKLGETLTDEDMQLRLNSALMVAWFHISDRERFEHYLTESAELVKSHVSTVLPSPLSDYALALAKIGRIEDALRVADSIQPEGKGKEFIRRAILEFDLTAYFIRTRQYQAAHQTANLLTTNGGGEYSDLYWGTRILMRLAFSLTEVGQLSEAQKIVDEIAMHVRSARPIARFSLTVPMLARYGHYELMFDLLDGVGIDEFARSIAAAADHFDAVEQGISLKLLHKIILVGSQKHDDYAELLPFVSP